MTHRDLAVTGPACVGGTLLGRLVDVTAVARAADEPVAEAVPAVLTGALAGRLAQSVHAAPTSPVSPRVAAARLLGRRPEPPTWAGRP